MEMATVQQIAVAFSAVVATLTFIYKVIDDRRSRTEKDILDWQKTVVHQIFQKSKSEWISFETVISTYRGEAADVPAKNLPKDVLTSAALRKILISMVSDRIVDQRGGDEYQLLTANREDALSRMLGGVSNEMLSGMSAAMQSLQGTSHEKQRELMLHIEELRSKSLVKE